MTQTKKAASLTIKSGIRAGELCCYVTGDAVVCHPASDHQPKKKASKK